MAAGREKAEWRKLEEKAEGTSDSTRHFFGGLCLSLGLRPVAVCLHLLAYISAAAAVAAAAHGAYGLLFCR